MRERWIENIKVVACILVVVGHLVQSLVRAAVIADSQLYHFFNSLIYYFHVQLFFIASGYLYQKYTNVHGLRGRIYNIEKKFLNLGVPYFFFSIVTLALKKIFEDSVNIQAEGFMSSLFLNPISPYWYLYTLFFLFVIWGICTKRKQMISYVIGSLVLYWIVIKVTGRYNVPFLLEGIMIYSVWFVLGEAMAFFCIHEKIQKYWYLFLTAFLLLAIGKEFFYVSLLMSSLVMGTLACLGIIGMQWRLWGYDKQNKCWNFISQYTFPIFLMHTIFAAPVRIVLLKIGIMQPLIHFGIGLAASIICPIIATKIMEYFKIDFVIYPGKYIKLRGNSLCNKKY